VRTDDPVGGDVFASFREAKVTAITSARRNRDLWARCARDLLAVTSDEVEES
jgi:hypothetical protein